MATTHIYNKLQDTSIYINLSSQNLHSAFAALKQEAKPLTTFNIKGLETKRGGERRGGDWASAWKETEMGFRWRKQGQVVVRFKDFLEGKKNEVYKCFQCKFLVLRG